MINKEKIKKFKKREKKFFPKEKRRCWLRAVLSETSSS